MARAGRLRLSLCLGALALGASLRFGQQRRRARAPAPRLRMSSGEASERQEEFVMAPVDPFDETRYGYVPFTPAEALELMQLQSDSATTYGTEKMTTLAVVVPSHRHHSAAFSVLRASLTMAGVANTVAQISDPIWAALYTHAAGKDQRSYGMFKKDREGDAVHRSATERLEMRQDRREYFAKALNAAHDAVGEATDRLVKQALEANPDADLNNVRVVLIADGDAGWICRFFLRARGKYAGITSADDANADPDAVVDADVDVDANAVAESAAAPFNVNPHMATALEISALWRRAARLWRAMVDLLQRIVGLFRRLTEGLPTQTTPTENAVTNAIPDAAAVVDENPAKLPEARRARLRGAVTKLWQRFVTLFRRITEEAPTYANPNAEANAGPDADAAAIVDAKPSMRSRLRRKTQRIRSPVGKVWRKIAALFRRVEEVELAMDAEPSPAGRETGNQALARLTLHSMIDEIRVRGREMDVSTYLSEGGSIPKFSPVTGPVEVTWRSGDRKRVSIASLVSVGRFQYGSAPAQSAYSAAAEMGKRRGIKEVDGAFDAGRGLFQGAALPAPEGVYVLELQGQGIDFDAGAYGEDNGLDAMTAEDFETEVVMSCLPKEGGTVMREDLCFVNFAKRPRKDPPVTLP
mmetsp:Transcript_42023/g.131654  ORF Transcript_42023/g.131654 Transcript_42023/m.131654 type:complete len:640 (-) Transcript_42023:574-2493(-)